MTTILRASVTPGLRAAPSVEEVPSTPSVSLAPDTYARPHHVVLLGCPNLREATTHPPNRLSARTGPGHGVRPCPASAPVPARFPPRLRHTVLHLPHHAARQRLGACRRNEPFT
ncbi:hypothetical protein GCM10010392_19280 [Streptomyces clavifer]|nr:hypothetical protein GCM10010392_19280 [Streptomyces clavifer]